MTNEIDLRKLTEHRITQLELLIREMHRLVDEMRLEVARLNVKAGLWGLIGGALPAGAVLLWILVQK